MRDAGGDYLEDTRTSYRCPITGSRHRSFLDPSKPAARRQREVPYAEMKEQWDAARGVR